MVGHAGEALPAEDLAVFGAAGVFSVFVRGAQVVGFGPDFAEEGAHEGEVGRDDADCHFGGGPEAGGDVRPWVRKGQLGGVGG